MLCTRRMTTGEHCSPLRSAFALRKHLWPSLGRCFPKQFLTLFVCDVRRGAHCAPVALTHQRIFMLCTRRTTTGEHCSPLRSSFALRKHLWPSLGRCFPKQILTLFVCNIRRGAHCAPAALTYQRIFVSCARQMTASEHCSPLRSAFALLTFSVGVVLLIFSAVRRWQYRAPPRPR